MNTNEVKIRKAKETDYIEVNALYYSTYDLYHKNIPETYKETPLNLLTKGSYLSMLEDKKTYVIVADLDNKVIGFLYASIEKEKGDEVSFGYHRVSIDEVSIDPAYRNQGVGSLLLEEAEKWTKKKRISDLTVLAYAFNENALNFYKKNGYEPYSVKLNKKI